MQVLRNSEEANIHISPDVGRLPRVLLGNPKILFADADCFVLQHHVERNGELACTVWVQQPSATTPPESCMREFNTTCKTEKVPIYGPYAFCKK
ncbi:hypothetical protein V5799_006342 [Amblyomma americanum]|uniref:Lipocalin n=1 Tax=Amblyomma americanum TaxID=6943 RepID=A0AAQ4DWN7_AMBAM